MKKVSEMKIYREDELDKAYANVNHIQLSMGGFVGSVVPFLGYLKDVVLDCGKEDLEKMVVRIYEEHDGHVMCSIGFPCKESA